MIKKILAVLCCLTICPHLYAENRASSAPYISGDSFRFSADFAYDEISRSMNPNDVKKGSTVFVKTDFLAEFFSSVHPHIPNRYILITSNSDDPAPGNYKHMLDDEKIVAWFAQNVENYSHSKLHPIPIGIANQCWKHGNVKALSKAQAGKKGGRRKHLLYMNFTTGTCPQERGFVRDLFKNRKFCYQAQPKNFISYLSDLKRSKFVLSPRGNGLDCHRTWEALYMGAIPIVKSSSSDSLFEGLPVLIVDDWSIIDEGFLNEQFLKISNQPVNDHKLYIDYWLNLIDSYRNDI